MNNKRIFVFVIAIFLLLVARVNAQDTILLYYSDGSVQEVAATQPSDSQLYSWEDVQAGVTLDAYVFIEDRTTNEVVNWVYPGQEVMLWIFFNPLGSLGIPFENLIGRSLVPINLLRGSLTHHNFTVHEIEPDEGGVVGIGIGYDVPYGESGYFLQLGLVFISGITCEENVDWGLRYLYVP